MAAQDGGQFGRKRKWLQSNCVHCVGAEDVT